MSDGALGLQGRLEMLRDYRDRHWLLVVIVAWLGLAAWLLFDNWARIRGFALGDTDDNMRMSQVRALLSGQDWFDLRQHKMNPPIGANIHWSRIPDLPIAGLILALRPLLGGANAERVAIAVVPLMPLLPMMLALALTTRRLVAPAAYPLAIATLFFAGSTLGMVNPTRIDHHGWQLALLAIGVSGMTDPRRARGGVTTGLAGAISLSIGLEMIIYIAVSGVATVLAWVDDRDERRRLAGFAISIGGGC
ncbi:MAG: AcrB/AcrD/AcrF family protein, partial [Sphingomicrobium sp.]